jgi:UDP-N-acetylglucosamine 1-carboxyvinyltransferase
MGADITIENDVIILHHADQLFGAEVSADEIRAGACLMTAGLMAQGETVISNVENILRGYDRVVDKLHSLGAQVEIIDDVEQISITSR